MTFKDLNLIAPLQKALDKQKYTVPTPIQLKSIPGLLQGKDLIGIAQTGTGKTAAFILPILQNMTEKYPREINTLVLAPTRELAAQIGESFSTYGEFLKFKHTVIFGGVRQAKQVKALNKGIDILVATPGRLMDLMNQGRISLKDVKFFVLDEADRMLDMGFIRDIRKIIPKLPQKRQSLFFSATMSPEVNKLARTLLRDPIHVEVAPQATTVESVMQYVFFVDQHAKERLLVKLLEHEHLTSVLVFTRTKHRANKVAMFLNKNGVNTDAIHGNKSQGARTKAIRDFKSGYVKVLVATDIAARGIDIDNISHVINFELPNESESYVHRIGRTARAGAEGTAFSFCAAEERTYLHDIEKLIKQKIEIMDHEFHSTAAQNATGAAARPPRKGGRNFGRSGKKQSFRKQLKARSNTDNKPDYRKRSRNKSNSNNRSNYSHKPKSGSDNSSNFKHKSNSNSNSSSKPKFSSNSDSKPKHKKNRNHRRR